MSEYIASSVRKLVHDRAADCCEYCLIPQAAVFAAHEIDHIIARKHGGSSEADNLALACILCNKYKGSDLTSIDPDTEQVVLLYHPRRENWSDHFRLQEAQFIGLTPTGRATIRLLQLNRSDRIEERQLLIVAKLIEIPK